MSPKLPDMTYQEHAYVYDIPVRETEAKTKMEETAGNIKTEDTLQKYWPRCVETSQTPRNHLRSGEQRQDDSGPRETHRLAMSS